MRCAGTSESSWKAIDGSGNGGGRAKGARQICGSEGKGGSVLMERTRLRGSGEESKGGGWIDHGKPGEDVMKS